MTERNCENLPPGLDEPMPETTIAPEEMRSLATAVIWEAIHNAHGQRLAYVGYGVDREIEQAQAFLSAADGPWAESRAIWCDLALIDPDALRDWWRRKGRHQVPTTHQKISHAGKHGRKAGWAAKHCKPIS